MTDTDPAVKRVKKKMLRLSGNKEDSHDELSDSFEAILPMDTRR